MCLSGWERAEKKNPDPLRCEHGPAIEEGDGEGNRSRSPGDAWDED
jgi:hypothetical protein